MNRTSTFVVMLFVAIAVQAQSRLSFECPGGGAFRAEFAADGGHAVLHYEGAVFELPRVISASGEKFSDGETVLWLKGGEAMVRLPDGTRLGGCRERAALSPYERRLLELPVRSTVELEIAWFNERLLEAAARGEVWILDSVETARRFIDSPPAPFEHLTRVEEPAEGPRRAVVTVVQGRLADDSLRAVWHRVELRREDFGRWTLRGASRAYLCRRGGQTEFFADEPCP